MGQIESTHARPRNWNDAAHEYHVGQHVGYKSPHGFIVKGTVVKKGRDPQGNMVYAFKQDNSPGEPRYIHGWDVVSSGPPPAVAVQVPPPYVQPSQPAFAPPQGNPYAAAPQQSIPPPQAYPYPPQQYGYPPQQQPGYPPQQQPGYPPQQHGYAPQQGYPQQQHGYPPPQGYPAQQGGWQGAPGDAPPSYSSIAPPAGYPTKQ